MPQPPLVATVAPAVFLALWVGCSVLMVLHPRLVWRIRDSWRATATPPPLYFWAMRLWGAVCAAAGIGLMLLVFARR